MVQGITKRGRLHDVGKEPVRVTIFDETYEALQLTMYVERSDYLSVRQELDVNTEKGRLQCNSRFVSGRLKLYFKMQILAKISSIIL